MSAFGPPANLRLVVIDTETTRHEDGKRRAVAIALVVCSGMTGAPGQQEAALINPGCPIDPDSQRKHKITDDDVADKPPFAEVWPRFAEHLKARKGETVVVVAHNAPFDLSLLREEIARTGATPALPDLAVLDTMRGLLDASGIEVDRRDLVSVAVACGVAFGEDQHHNALADATATALAARVMLNRALSDGQADLASVLASTSDGRTSTASQRGPSDPESEEPERVVVPNAHLALHAKTFPARPTAADRARWTALFSACASLRCLEMAAPDGILPHEKRRLLFAVLAETTRRGDSTATATVLGALAPLFPSLPSSIADLRTETGANLVRVEGRGGERGVAVVLWQHLTRLLAAVPQCSRAVPCRACRGGVPCPRDTWPLALAAFALPEATEKTATAFWNPSGQGTDERGKGAGRGWSAMWAVAPGLADAMLRRCLDFYRATRQFDLAASVAEQVWREGCRDPMVVAIHAETAGTPNRAVDLSAAIAACQQALALRHGSSDWAWDQLDLLTANLEGRLARSMVPPASRHAAQNPKRPARTPRFVRVAPS